MKNHDHPDSLEGIVYKKINGAYEVRSNGSSFTCILKSNGKGRAADLPVAGDRVTFIPRGGQPGVIQTLLPRENQLARRSAVPMPGAHAHRQVLAANLDQVVPVFAAANPPPHWNMLDRYLVLAEASGIPALVLITKTDLLAGEPGQATEIKAVADEYRRIGYPVLLASAHSGEGMQAVRAALQGKVSALLGKSGVGKSSLLNTLQPGLELRVNTISRATGKGRHTTTQPELFDLDGESAILDTPGMREFGLCDLEDEDLAFFFPEMRPYIGACRFGLSCRHDEEPGCAVRQAVMAGHISPRRYKSYLTLEVDA